MTPGYSTPEYPCLNTTTSWPVTLQWPVCSPGVTWWPAAGGSLTWGRSCPPLSSSPRPVTRSPGWVGGDTMEHITVSSINERGNLCNHMVEFGMLDCLNQSPRDAAAHKKVKHIGYNGKRQPQPYLICDQLDNEMRSLLFNLRAKSHNAFHSGGWGGRSYLNLLIFIK